MNREEKIRWFIVGFIVSAMINTFLITFVFRSPGPGNAVHSYTPQGSPSEPLGPLIDTNKCLKCHTLLFPYDTEITNTKL